jgi:Leucine-rich repeat (LRR) protein
LPKSDKLERLELAGNQLTGAELKHLTTYAISLVSLKLANNRIASFEDLEPLKKLTKLATLYLEGNPVTNKKGYIAKVFEMLPHLQVLDNHD